MGQKSSPHSSKWRAFTHRRIFPSSSSKRLIRSTDITIHTLLLSAARLWSGNPNDAFSGFDPRLTFYNHGCLSFL